MLQFNVLKTFLLISLFLISCCFILTLGEPVSDDGNSSHNLQYDNTSTSQKWSRRLPDALIIGAKKSGTRALLEFLKVHPNVKATGPESHFFDRKYHLGFDWYRKRMPLAQSSHLVMEKTPAYLVHRQSPSRVHAMNPNIKLLLVVRNPVYRAISDYTQAVDRRGVASVGSFEGRLFINDSCGSSDCQINTSWSAVKIGLYANYLTSWLEYFPKDQIHIVSGEDLISRPSKVLNKVEKFLKLPPFISENEFYLNSSKGFYCLKKHWRTGRPKCLDRNKGRSHPKISNHTLKLLTEFYREPNQRFYNISGIHFGWTDASSESTEIPNNNVKFIKGYQSSIEELL